jgi:RNA polymerase sigma-70 factor (ECF subfamily)
MADAFEWDWEHYRKLLHFLLRKDQLDPKYRRRFDSSDVVQETLLRAAKYKDQCRGILPGERIAWMKKILKNVVHDMIEHENADKRNLDRDRSIHELAKESSRRLDALLPADQSTPAERAQREEELMRMAEAMEELEEAQRDVLILRFYYALSLKAIAEQLGKSETSIGRLYHRGLAKLRERLAYLRN